MNKGRLYFPDGKELSLWGVNFQPCLSWEYNERLKPVGVQLTSSDLKSITDNSLDEIQRMGTNVIRCHLTPADFTDANGNLVQTVYLDILDYMIAEASKRNIYIYITLINHMGSSYVTGSFMSKIDPKKRQRLIFDKRVVEQSKNYIKQLLNRTNPYLQTTYKSNPKIALWEILNEPAFSFYNYSEIKNTPYYDDFLNWIALHKSGVNNEASFSEYRKQFVLNYINDIYTTIRSTGAVQPIVWNCNWPNFRKGNEDIFTAVAHSKVEVVSFCCYPGQNLLSDNYWDNPKDLTESDYSNFFKNNYNDINGYGWALSSDFKDKAKVVYEYEAFFNQSSYIYPLMAQYFRALGVQVAAMWTYNLAKSAPYNSGSHFLSLTCTPAKAASFVVANDLFTSIPLYTPYNMTSPNEQIGENFALSKKKDVSMIVTKNKFYYTGDVSKWCPFIVSKKVKDIVGRGNSPLVLYNGTGVYFLNETNNELFLTIEPNSKWLIEPWRENSDKSLVTQLDYTTTDTMSIMLDKWEKGNFVLYSLKNGHRERLTELSDFKNIPIVPGNYVVVHK
jgi:hypothetical protein